ncbi:MAG: type II toxin-antitoxin system HicA family toxin [Phycisphaerae bacterium]|nr:type II toxin-antitoxin system HicA family toxin [Phycisphaerae bacterium]
MTPRKLLARLGSGALHNVSFSDMAGLVEALGFHLGRINGSHHIFIHTEIPELLNMQNVSGQAKPYQIRQFLRLLERYNMILENDR